jgi:hypothetical protein
MNWMGTAAIAEIAKGRARAYRISEVEFCPTTGGGMMFAEECGLGGDHAHNITMDCFDSPEDFENMDAAFTFKFSLS